MVDERPTMIVFGLLKIYMSAVESEKKILSYIARAIRLISALRVRKSTGIV